VKDKECVREKKREGERWREKNYAQKVKIDPVQRKENYFVNLFNYFFY
jgi:hypothetical protein